LDIEDSLDSFARKFPRQAIVARLHFFGELHMDEIAKALGLSKRTVESDWAVAMAWLRTHHFADPRP
jgi:DNA-directed RNA polymerase specialized sigma24 family protein